MRILFLSTWHPYPPDNGSKLRVSYLLRALAQRHDVTLIAFDFNTQKSASDAMPDSNLVSIERIAVDPFAAARNTGRLARLSMRSNSVWSVPAMRSAVQRRLQLDSTEVVIASTFVCASYALDAAPLTVKILEEHNSLTRWIWDRYRQQSAPLPRLRRWLSWQKTRHLEARLYGHFDLVTAVSAQDAGAMCAMLPGYRGQVETVPNGVDCSYNLMQPQQRVANTLVYNGAVTYSANYDAMQFFLSSIFPLIRESMPDTSLTITGSTDDVDLSNLAVNSAIHFSGYVPDIRVPVAQAAVCIVPLRDGSGTRLKILEAMALGTPVVATSKGAEGLDIVNDIHFLLADTPADFAKATIRLLRNPELCGRLAANARRLVEEEYDWQRIGAQFVQLVEQTVINRQKRGLDSQKRGRRKNDIQS